MSKVASIHERRGQQAPPNERLAPAPQVDKNPTIIGQGLSVSYVSACLRSCILGFRQQYVDLLDEMLEKDAHAYSVVSKRVLTVAAARISVEVPDGLEDADLTAATEAAEFIENELASIRNLPETLVMLSWATYYAVACCEIVWAQGDDGQIHIVEFDFVHQRRLSYPDPWTWDIYIWDQGAININSRQPLTSGMFGLRIDDYPNQFVVHAPKVRGDYPTREGIGRELLYWMTLKNAATRLAPQYLERFAIPWTDIEFNTKQGADKLPREATDQEIADAQVAANGASGGSLKTYVHSDAIVVKLVQPEGRPALTFKDWIELCDAQESKVALGATLTTEIGHAGGNRAAAGVQKEGEEKLYEFDAVNLASTIKRDVATPLLKLNRPALPPRLYPQIKLHVNADPDPLDIIERATKAAAGGIPVDADAIAQQCDLPVIENKSGQPRRMFPLLGAKISPPPEVIGLPPAPEEPDADDSAQGATKPPPNDGADSGEEPEEQDDARNDSDA